MKIRSQAVPVPFAVLLVVVAASLAPPLEAVAQEELTPLDVVMLQSVSAVSPTGRAKRRR